MVFLCFSPRAHQIRRAEPSVSFPGTRKVRENPERRNGFFAVEQLILRIRRVGRRRNPEAYSARIRRGHRGGLLRQRLDLVAEEVRRESELTIVARKNGNDVVRNDVTVRVQEVGRVVHNL